MAPPLSRRGYNVLCFEGPGQSGAYLLDPSLTYRYDWEVPTSAVVDYLAGRPEVDAGRIAYIGYSWGGYFVPRAAAFERRISACVANCLLPEVYSPVVQTMEVDQLLAADQPITDDQLTTKQRYSIDEGLPRFGFKPQAGNLAAWAEMLKKMTLWGLEDKITIPLLNMSSTGEGKLMHDNAKAFYGKLPNPAIASSSPARTKALNCTLSAATRVFSISWSSTGSTRSSRAEQDWQT